MLFEERKCYALGAVALTCYPTVKAQLSSIQLTSVLKINLLLYFNTLFLLIKVIS